MYLILTYYEDTTVSINQQTNKFQFTINIGNFHHPLQNPLQHICDCLYLSFFVLIILLFMQPINENLTELSPRDIQE